MIEQDNKVERDPNASRQERMAALAWSATIVLNHIIDPTYAPYCMLCPGLHRMRVVSPFLWEHTCGAIHDERQVLAVDSTSIKGVRE